MEKCIFCKREDCKTRAILSVQAISNNPNEKLTQFILCLLNGDTVSYKTNIRQISKKNSLRNIDICHLVRGCNCAGFVSFCLRNILSYNINPYDILDGKVFNTNSRYNNFYWIRNPQELESLTSGDLLYCIHAEHLNLNLKPAWEASRDMIDIKGPLLDRIFDNRGRSQLFSHVFFYLGHLYPYNKIYVGGMNHPHPLMQFGIYEYVYFFSFNNDGQIHFSTDATKLYLVAQRLF